MESAVEAAQEAALAREQSVGSSRQADLCAFHPEQAQLRRRSST